LLKEKSKEIGWTGEYVIPDPTLPDPSRPNLKQIEIGCEIALKLLIKYPDFINKIANPDYFSQFRNDFFHIFDSVKNQIDNKSIHFIANNLGVKDLFLSKHWGPPEDPLNLEVFYENHSCRKLQKATFFA